MAMVTNTFEKVNLAPIEIKADLIPEEEEEEEEEEEDDDDNIYYVQDTQDDPFYLANRTFYTTCHKISRQNSPNYRKRPPYSFLQNWLIHSVFSKSQQILLRFPVIHPKVMMTEGDFIYTPHQMANENQQADLYYEEDEDYDYYDDAFVIGDEGVMVMSASAPDASQFMAADDDDEEENVASSIVMDENMWMGHSRYNTNGLTLHVVNPDNDDEDDEEEDDPMYHSVTSSNNPYKSIEEEEEEEEEQHIPTKLSMSPEVLHWYRSADTRPTIHIEDKSIEDQHCKNNCGCSTSSNSSTTSTCSNTSKSDEVEKTATRRSSDSYQSLADIIEEEQLRDYGTLPTYHNRSIVTSTKKVSALMQVSVCFVDAAWVAMDIAQTYAENSSENKSVTGFINCLFRIWKALFLGAETMLGWGNHRLKPQAMV
ncbi:hypothetical protein BDF21DRAFT_387173 [Thamnidium elegans]|nr:hypothetical protein BDF21DRAFT_387173 [Thamnidium elegans]